MTALHDLWQMVLRHTCRRRDLLRMVLNVASCVMAGVAIPVALYGLHLGVRCLFFDQFVVPTLSMYPTLLPGDRIIVDKTLMGARLYTDLHFSKEGQPLKAWRMRGTRGVRRNDIVVFNYPQHGWRISFVINHVYAKRCVALPGDSLAIVEGYYKNSNCADGAVGYLPAQRMLASMPDGAIDSTAFHIYPFDAHLPYTLKNMPPLYVPRKGDVLTLDAHHAAVYRMLLEWETGCAIEPDWEHDRTLADGRPLRTHTFAHNYYFMAGDNVPDSNDSRYWSLVPEEYIVGIVTHISYSRDRATGEWRQERFMKRVDGGL